MATSHPLITMIHVHMAAGVAVLKYITSLSGKKYLKSKGIDLRKRIQATNLWNLRVKDEGKISITKMMSGTILMMH